MEDFVCAGYFPALSWQYFRSKYPKLSYDDATQLYLTALHRAVEQRKLYTMEPPFADSPRLGTKLIGNVVTGERASYWIADADEIVRYFQSYWPQTELADEAESDHFFKHFPCFCFPMDKEVVAEHPDIDWDDYFMFF
ncbi:MAG: hypothetical protein DI498_01300 [Paracoccus denitrificans]|nr:MAG: hypothetical protein DI498_01300 [Paracoccus denitrificans]PZO85804.1 MAG: hypothetical protein DI633_01300 [Paracoccus denitrificans]